MKVEVPEFKRCCCCIPLRYGLLVWGYIKLILTILLTAFFTFYFSIYIRIYMMYPVGILLVQVMLLLTVILVLLLDNALTIVFLVGGHKKNARLMRIFYIYSIVLLSITTPAGVVTTTLELYYNAHYRASGPNENLNFGFKMQAKIIVALATFATELYVILLIRSEIVKLNNNCKFRFSNVANEAECTMENEINDQPNATYERTVGTYDQIRKADDVVLGAEVQFIEPNGITNGLDKSNNEPVDHNIDSPVKDILLINQSFNYKKL